MTNLEGCGMAVVAIAIHIIVSILLAWPVMWLWNYCMPAITGGVLSTITFWQTLALMVMIRLIMPTPTVTKNND